MNSKHRRKLFTFVIADAAQNFKDHQELERSRIGRKVQNSDHEFAKKVLSTANKLDSVEDMIAFEQSLQRLDILKAKSSADRGSIIVAQKSYEKFAKTLEKMRKDPDSYFEMNMGNKEYNGDPRDIIKSNSLDFISANITRMQNRKQFASESESEIWDARIAMAKKTGDMFKTLHNHLAADFMRKQEIRFERDKQE